MKVEKIITTTETHELEIVGATLLSVEEAEKLPVRLRKHNLAWWLRSPSDDPSRGALVFNNGSVDITGIYILDARAAVRPALKIENLKSSALKIGDTFVFGGKRFETINEELAFCLEDIGNCVFRSDWKADDANDYDKSDVKKFVDEWFEEASK